MPDSIIVENVTKKYTIRRLQKETQFREVLVNVAKRIFSRIDERKEDILALNNISFSMKKGEIVGLIGRNGAGKSTLLKVLSRITYPTVGRVVVNGRVGSLLEVGTGFHEELTGRENIFLNGSILGMKKREVKEKLDEIIAFSEVEQFLDTPIKRYSSGMRLRLGFSVAAHLDTDILFVDEVLAVGDIAFQRKCLNVMENLNNSGRTVVLVSHNMTPVEELCHRVIWIDKGQIKQDGDTAEVVKSYRDQYNIPRQSSGYDLTNAFQREGTGEIRFLRIDFLETDGTPKEIIRSGDSLKVRIHYKVESPVPRPKFYLRIYTNEKPIKVATFGNTILGMQMPMIYPGTGYADIDINSLNIMPDRYFLNLWIHDGRNKYIEHLVRCVTFDVESSDYYNSGKGIDKQEGITFLKYSWNFNNDGMIAP
jgi:lipopolysaccharide transport system ATP-binding protein